jgi:UDP-3-O-[3-hydroxymyristoyl] glucosamine N-acyltransferase
MRLADLAARLALPYEGEGSTEIVKGASLESAGRGDITFLGNPKLAARAAATKASAIVLPPGAPAGTAAVLRAPDPYLAFADALELLHPVRPPAAPGVHPTAVVAKGARVGPGAAIGAHAVVEDDVELGKDVCLGPHVVLHRGVRVGDGVVIHSHTVVREGCRIGNRVVLQDHVVIGADGFGFAKRKDGTHRKIPQVGIVVIEDDVEVQAGSCIDRAMMGETRIGRGTKIDNLVQVGHGCTVGEDTILCAQVGLSGSTTVGRGVTLAGQVGAGGHLTIGDGVTAVAQSGIAGDVEPRRVIAGSPAMDMRDWLRASAAFPRLADLQKEVRELKKRVEALGG